MRGSFNVLLFAVVVGTASAACPIVAVEYEGYCYSTFDQCAPDAGKLSNGCQSSCHNTYTALPTGWSLVDDTPTVRANVVGQGTWGTDVVILSNGAVLKTQAYHISMGGAQEYTSSGGLWVKQILSNGGSSTTTFKSGFCAGKVLVKIASGSSAPIAVLSAPAIVGTCDDVVLDASSSHGGWIDVAWSVSAVVARDGTDAGAAAATQASITNALSAASSGALMTVTLARALFDDASSCTFTLTLTDAQGLTGAASAAVTRVHDVLPSVAINGPPHVAVTRTATLDVVGVGALPTCNAALAVSDAVALEWILVSATTAAAADAFRAALPAFTQRNPRTLAIPAGFLAISTTYFVQLNATMGARWSFAQMTIEVLAQPPIALVDGGSRTLVAGSAFRLNASSSRDPDAAAWLGAEALTYAWACTASSHSANAPCAFAANVAASKRSSASMTLSAAEADAAFALPVYLGNGTVTFTLVMTATSIASGLATSITVELTFQLAPAAGTPALPLVAVAAPTQPTARTAISASAVALKLDATSKTVFVGSLDAEGGVAVADVSWAWSGTVVPSGAAVPPSSFASGLASPILVVKPGALASGVAYRFVLRATSKLGGGVGMAMADVATNTAPSLGALAVTPASGVDGLTEFKLTTTDWIDGDRPLRYIFSSRALGSMQTQQAISSLTLTNTLDGVILSSGGSSLASVSVQLFVTAVDTFGASSAAAAVATVTLTKPTLAAGQSMAGYLLANDGARGLEQSVADGDVSGAMQRITAFAALVNGADDGSGAPAAGTAANAAARELNAKLINALRNTTAVAPATTEAVDQLAFALSSTAAAPSTLNDASRQTLADLTLGASTQCVETEAKITAESATNVGSTISKLLGAPAAASAAAGVEVERKLASGISVLGSALLRTAVLGEDAASVTTSAFKLASQVQSPTNPAAIGDFGPLNGDLFGASAALSIVTITYYKSVHLHSSAVDEAAAAGASSAQRRRLGAAKKVHVTTNVMTMQVKPRKGKGGEGSAPSVATGSSTPLVRLALRNNGTVVDGVREREDALCQYWDVAATRWASRGMVSVAVRDTHVVCETAHLTDFSGAVMKSATPEVNIVDPVGDAHLLLNYDHTNAAVPIIVGIFNLLMLFGCIVGAVIDCAARRRAKKEDRFGWRDRHNHRSAGARDFSHELEFEGERVSIHLCLPRWVYSCQCCGYGLNSWSIQRCGCGCNDSLCGLASGGGVICANLRLIITQHSILSIFCATPTFHPFTRAMRTGLLWIAYLTAFAVEALMWGKDDSRLEQKLRIAIVAALCMSPPLWFFHRVLASINTYHQRKAEFEAYRLHFKVVKWPLYVLRRWWRKEVVQRAVNTKYFITGVVSGAWFRHRFAALRESFALKSASVAPAQPQREERQFNHFMESLEMVNTLHAAQKQEEGKSGEGQGGGDDESVSVPVAPTPTKKEKKEHSHFQFNRKAAITQKLEGGADGAAGDNDEGDDDEAANAFTGAVFLAEGQHAKAKEKTEEESNANAAPALAPSPFRAPRARRRAGISAEDDPIHNCCCGMDGIVSRAMETAQKNAALTAVAAFCTSMYQRIVFVFMALRPLCLLGAWLGVMTIFAAAVTLAIWAVALSFDMDLSLALLVMLGAGALVACAYFEARTLAFHRRELHLLFACVSLTVATCIAHSALATVLSVPIGSAKHDFGDGALEAAWSVLPSAMVTDIQTRYGCCGYTYLDPLDENVEVDEWGKLRRKKKGGGGASKPAREGDAAASADVPCPQVRTSRSMAPLILSLDAPQANATKTWTLLQTPASCRVELQVRGEGGMIWSHGAPAYIIALFLAALHLLCFVGLMLSIPPEQDDEETIALREKWDHEKMTPEESAIVHDAALRMQCVFRGFVERRRIFFRRHYVAWASKRMDLLRQIISGIAYVIMIAYITFMTYICLLYGVKFSPDQASSWITSTAWACLIEIFVQEPLLIVSSAVLFASSAVGHVGDMVTEALGI